MELSRRTFLGGLGASVAIGAIIPPIAELMFDYDPVYLQVEEYLLNGATHRKMIFDQTGILVWSPHKFQRWTLADSQQWSV